MPRFAAVHPAKFTLATANGPTAPVNLHTFEPPQSTSDLTATAPQFTPLNRWNPLNWFFGFLRDGTTSVPSTSKALGRPTKASLFPQGHATGGLLSHARPSIQHEHQSTSSDTPNAPPSSNKQPFPPWSTWKNWKKITFDLYIRLLDTPQHSRLRLKQTIAPLPILKVKPVIDLAYRGPSKSPLTMHMDVKFLDCIKYRVHTDGSSHFQVRARAPMSDPRFTMDVIYERQIGTALDSVKITFRALNVAFLKAPSPGFGLKIPIRFNNGIKSTIRVKKFIDRTSAISNNVRSDRKRSRRGHLVNAKLRTSSRYSENFDRQIGSNQHRDSANRSQIGVYGPIGVDIKLRCLEYR